METVLDGVSAFWDYLASVHRVALALAIACHLAKTVCASRGRRNVLVSAYPETRVRWLSPKHITPGLDTSFPSTITCSVERGFGPR